MKRSRSVHLVVMAVGGFGLSACGNDEVSGNLYTSTEDCRAGGHTRAFCEAQHAEAVRLHLLSAPVYQSQRNCETDFGLGACEPNPGGPTGTFIPQMSAFLVGEAEEEEEERESHFYYGRIYTQPIYRLGRGGLRTASEHFVRRGSGSSATIETASLSEPRRSTTISRGGFGSRSFASGG